MDDVNRFLRKTALSGLAQAETFIFAIARVFIYLIQYVINLRGIGFARYLRSFGARAVVDCNKIASDALQLPKVPKHVAFVIGEKEYDRGSVVNMIAWSLMLGASNVTIADEGERVEDDAEAIQQSFEEKCKNPHYKQCPKCVFHTGMSKAENVASCNVILTSPKSTQDFFMVHVRNTCSQMKGNANLKKTMNPDKFSEILEAAKGPIPEPCLLVVFGQHFTYYGFNPWSLRLTEITNVPSHCNLSYENLLWSFRKFAKCEQRWGI